MMPRWITLDEFDRLVQAMRREHGPAAAEHLALRLLPLLRRKDVTVMDREKNTTEETP